MLKWKDHRTKRLFRQGCGALMLIVMLYSCASIGRPDGGPIDITPPVFLGSTPVQGALNNERKRIVLQFDEYIKLEKVNEKVVISPPQIKYPEIKTSGKRVVVELFDTLKDNTTYTIDFGDAIVDNNESNPLGDFAFIFSTGDVIDTLVVSGILLEASNLEPIKGMLVGLHSNLADSAFTTLPLDRVGRTDSRGRFSIRGISPGSYRVFGLQDGDMDFKFSQKSEAIAFYDSIVVPRFEERIRQDTLWKDSITIDTIIAREYTHYLPDDLLMRAFTEESFNQYFVKSERLTPEKFTLYFNAKADTLPTLEGLNFEEEDAFIIERSVGNDTITYWIKDSLLYKQDTLRVAMNYLYTDTLLTLVPRTDTLDLYVRRTRGGGGEAQTSSSRGRRGKRGEAEEDTVPKTEFMQVTSYAPGTIDLYDYLHFTFPEPLAHYDREMLHLREKVDTIWVDVPFEFEQDSLELRRYNLFYDWEPEKEYEFEADSTAFHGIYGLFTDRIHNNIKIRSLDEYGAIFFNLTGIDTPAFVELLDVQDKVVRRRTVTDGNADFYYLKPGQYGARLISDTNNNGKWDTGNYEEGRQPEEVFYYPQILDLKALWEIEQDWNVRAVPLSEQKPYEMKKQKPDEDNKKNTTDRNNRSSNNNNNNNRSSNSSSRR